MNTSKMSAQSTVQFYPFASSINSAFWEAFSKLKLNELCLNTDPISIKGVYSNRIVPGIPQHLHLQYDAFTLKCESQPKCELSAPGTFICTNTIEEFKQKNKTELMNSVSKLIWDAIASGEAEKNPSILSLFLVLVYGDLKNHSFYYWFAFPAFMYPCNVKLLCSPDTLDQKFSNKDQIDRLQASLQCYGSPLNFFTVLLLSDGEIRVKPLSAYKDDLQDKQKDCQVWLCFADPSNSPEHPSWLLRNLLTLAAVRWSNFKQHSILCLREKTSQGVTTIGQSLFLEIEILDAEGPLSNMPTCLGWEKNERGKMGPKCANLKKTMEPSRIVESSVELNLKLMRWRLVPTINLDAIHNCRCLLIGAGTLGCNVARCLLGWNVHKITFVDCGRVSYSNPVRQSLFNFEDCLGEGKLKAEAATEALKRIFPRVDAQSVILTVPMPGHSVSPSEREQVAVDVSTLEALIDSHDAIFLLTDSRESRWLPTLLGAAKNKIVLTAALGFDSYLVMRHGVPKICDGKNENILGCYFCNDVVAPGDGMWILKTQFLSLLNVCA